MRTFIHTPDESDNIVYEYDSLLPSFDARQAIDSTIAWIRDAFRDNGGKIAVIGISGGKDSSVVAALCAHALGKDNVIGVKMSDGTQPDWEDQDDIIEHLGIKSIDFDISAITDALRETAADVGIATPGWTDKSYSTVPEDMWDTPDANRENSDEAAMEDDFGILLNNYELPRQAAMNMPPRVRLVVLYMIAQSLNVSARVVGTANLSEAFIGWDTRYGGCGGSGCDLLPIASYTATEVIAIGKVLGIPDHLLFKQPADGLTGKTDEENFGFSYWELDAYIRQGDGARVMTEIKDKIDDMHDRNAFKMAMPPVCPSGLETMPHFR